MSDHVGMKDESHKNHLQIPRVAADTEDFDFRQYREQQKPVIFTGATAKWGAYEKWTLDYFADKLGEYEYMAEIELPSDVPINHDLSDYQHSVRMKDFVQRIKKTTNGGVSYITNKSVDRFPGLARDLSFEELLGVAVSDELTRLWIGTANTKSSLHFDPYENVLCQMFGQKRVYLVDPRYTSRLYQYSSNIDKSQVDVEKPDLTGFPRFCGVPVYEGVLSSGDCVFIPKVWWHSARSLDSSISVNCFFGERIGERELLPLMLAGGPRLIVAFLSDFFWNGFLGRPYRKRLYAAEPFGVWFYLQLRNSIKRRMHHVMNRLRQG